MLETCSSTRAWSGIIETVSQKTRKMLKHDAFHLRLFILVKWFIRVRDASQVALRMWKTKVCSRIVHPHGAERGRGLRTYKVVLLSPRILLFLQPLHYSKGFLVYCSHTSQATFSACFCTSLPFFPSIFSWIAYSLAPVYFQSLTCSFQILQQLRWGACGALLHQTNLSCLLLIYLLFCEAEPCFRVNIFLSKLNIELLNKKTKQSQMRI